MLRRLAANKANAPADNKANVVGSGTDDGVSVNETAEGVSGSLDGGK